MDAIWKSFSHLSRDIQIYLISGFVTILQSCWLFKEEIIINDTFDKTLYFASLIIASYIFGHLTYGICDILNLLKINIKDKEILDIKMFNKSQMLYSENIERYTTLYQMRYNIALNNFIVVAIGVGFCIYYLIVFNRLEMKYLIVSIANFMSFVIMAILATSTKTEYLNRFRKLEEYLNQQ
jgi:hypothetical protein